jgi:hypothetical protein
VVDGKTLQDNTLAAMWPVAVSRDLSRWATVKNTLLPVEEIKYKGELVLNGQVDSEHSTSLEQVVFSPDGKQIAFYAGILYRGESARVFVDKRLIGSHVCGWITPFTFSPDGKHVAYAFGSNTTHAIRFAVDGAVTPEYDAAYKIQYNSLTAHPFFTFSPDGVSFAYIPKKGFDYHLVIDSQESDPFEEVGPENTRVGFNPEGRFTFLARQGGAIYWIEVIRQQ